jgi:hypothetical protein
MPTVPSSGVARYTMLRSHLTMHHETIDQKPLTGPNPHVTDFSRVGSQLIRSLWLPLVNDMMALLTNDCTHTPRGERILRQLHQPSCGTDRSTVHTTYLMALIIYKLHPHIFR